MKRKRFLFFAYREWAINIFNRVSNLDDEFILILNKNLCTKKFIDTISPDVVFFYGWSWIVPDSIVDNYICLCLHPSKLPRYRGGSPIQNQIIAGEVSSAVSIFKMGSGLDDGPIYYQAPIVLTGSLDNILKEIGYLGHAGTKCFIDDYKNSTVVFKEQNHDEATFCKRRTPKDSEIKAEDFLKHDSEYFFNMVRSLQAPYPECYIKCKTGRIIFKEINYE
jgi:methionyl-tRNA formyltransferase